MIRTSIRSQISSWPSIGSSSLIALSLLATFAGCDAVSDSRPETATPLAATSAAPPTPNLPSRSLQGNAKQVRTRLSGRRLDGIQTQPFDDETTRAAVFVFITTQCPIANAYHPYLAELYDEYHSQGVEFYLVHSSSDITEPAARAHVVEYNLNIPVLLDPEQALAKRLDAKVTPQAFLLDRQQTTIYQGAINNLYAGYGKKRARATRHYLRDALDQHLAGQAIDQVETEAIGCFIAYQ